MLEKFLNNFKKTKEKINLKKEHFLFCFILFFFVFYSILYIFYLKPPSNFPVNKVVEIRDGQNLSEVSHYLEEKNVIKSNFWLLNFVVLLGGERNINSGDYVFEYPMNVFKIAREITNKKSSNFYPLKVTIPEGLNVFEVSELLSKYLENFDIDDFIEKAEEGYLFPDTYYFFRSSSVDSVISIMKNNFWRKINHLNDEIEKSERSFEEILIMASILETEAREFEHRRKISGILWNRIDIGMPLQVDVVFRYINGKNTYELTMDDLKIDSPYNTYLYSGFPPTPIANPSLDSIKAAINPKENDYFYFLSDREGNMYYGKNFDEHIENRRLYMD